MAVKTVSASIRERIEATMTLARPILDRLIAVGSIQSAIVIAAQAFMAVFPLLIAVIAYSPAKVGNTISTFMRTRLGLSSTTAQVQQLVSTRSELQNSLSIFGLIVVLASATSFTRALQRVYERSWQLPPGGVRGSLRGLLWLIGLVIYFFMLAFMFELTSSRTTGISALRLVLSGVTAFGLWWMTPFLLLCGRVRWRALVLTGLLTGIVLVVAGKVSTVIMPRIVSSNERKYGTIGAVFAIQSWLVVMACIIVGAAILGAITTESDGWIGTWARGSSDLESWHRVPTGIFARGRTGRSALDPPVDLPPPVD